MGIYRGDQVDEVNSPKRDYKYFVADVTGALLFTDQTKKGIFIPCVYIINAQDFVLFDFYTNKNELENFLGNDLIMKFTFDLFHAIEPETYAGNQLLIVDNKNTKIISLQYLIFLN